MNTVREEFIDILDEQLDIDRESLTDESSIADDLGADSLDQVELLMECEDRFGILIPEEAAEAWTTVGQALAWLDAQGATVKPAPAE